MVIVSKYCCGYYLDNFGVKFGKFIFKHLVTLTQDPPTARTWFNCVDSPVGALDCFAVLVPDRGNLLDKLLHLKA